MCEKCWQKEIEKERRKDTQLIFFKDDLLNFDYLESSDVSNDTETGKLLTCTSNILIRGMQVFYDCNIHKSNYLKM